MFALFSGAPIKVFLCIVNFKCSSLIRLIILLFLNINLIVEIVSRFCAEDGIRYLYLSE